MSLLRTTDSILNFMNGDFSGIPIFSAFENTIVESIVFITNQNVVFDSRDYTEIKIYKTNGIATSLLFTISTEFENLNKFVAYRYDMQLTLIRNEVLYFTKTDNGISIDLGSTAYNTNERRL